MCIPPERLEVLQDIVEQHARWALGPETKRTEDVTVLWDSEYFSKAMIKEFEKVFNLDPNIWCMTIRSKQGHELTMFEGDHPISPAK